MRTTKLSLEDAVLNVFEQACQQRDLAVAEHLLRALEVIAQRSDEGERLQRAFLHFAHLPPLRKLHS